MMKTLRMYGESDDLIEVEGIEGANEYYPNVSHKDPYMATFIVESQSEATGMQIHVLYDGCWSFAVSADDSETLPNWPMRRSWGGGRGYSELLEIDVPDDAMIKQKEQP